MVESRCGILCSECEYREQVNCKGCVSIHKSRAIMASGLSSASSGSNDFGKGKC